MLRGRLSLSLVWFSMGRVGAARGFSRLSEGLQLSAHILPLLFGLLSPAALFCELLERLASFVLECGLCSFG